MWRNLGEGYASLVYHAFCNTTRTPVAIKAYKKSRLSRLNDFQVRREVAIHGALRHPSVVGLYAAFEDASAYYLVQELAGKGDLFVAVRKRETPVTEKDAILILLSVMDALLCLHDLDVIHRDLKPENIFVTADGTHKIGDFGLAICVHDERPVTRVGTLDYMAPEILLCHNKERPEEFKDDPVTSYGHNVDCWAVGVLAYELLTGRPPFRGKDRQVISQAIMTQRPQFPGWCSSEAVDFMTSTMAKSSAKRPDMRTLLKHPWVTPYLQRGLWERVFGEPGVGARAETGGAPAGPPGGNSGLVDGQFKVQRSAQSIATSGVSPAAMLAAQRAAEGAEGGADELPPRRRANPGRPTTVAKTSDLPSMPAGGAGAGNLVQRSGKSMAALPSALPDHGKRSPSGGSGHNFGAAAQHGAKDATVDRVSSFHPERPTHAQLFGGGSFVQSGGQRLGGPGGLAGGIEEGDDVEGDGGGARGGGPRKGLISRLKTAFSGRDRRGGRDVGGADDLEHGVGNMGLGSGRGR